MSVKLFEHADFTGKSKLFNAGFYDMAALSLIGNDAVSSLIIGPRTELTMYEDWHGWGRTYHQRNDSDVEMKINYIGDDFNDKVSSLKVQEIVKNTIDGLEGIKIYSESNFGGKSYNLKTNLHVLPPHAITIRRFLGWNPTDRLNNDVSSIQVGTGFGAKLHDSENFSGNEIWVTGNISVFNLDWDNKVSSIEVYRLGQRVH